MRSAVAVVLGFTLLSIGTFVLTALGSLTTWFVWILVLVTLASGATLLPAHCRDLGVVVRSWQPKLPELTLLVVLIVCLVLLAVEALAPPSAADTMAYHFVLPKRFLAASEFYYIPGVTMNSPVAMHMLYTLGMAICCDRLAALLALAHAVVLGGCMVTFGQRHLGSAAIGLGAAALLLSTPMVVATAASGHIDVALSLYTFVGFWGLFEYHRSNQAPWLIIAGVATGMAAGSKYYGLFSALLFGLMIIGHHTQSRHGPERIIRALLVFGIVAAIVASPSYLRNLMLTGNPVFPALYDLLGGRDWSVEVNAALGAALSAKRTLPVSIESFFLIPWHLTMDGDRFLAGRNGFGPGFLMALPLVVWYGWRFSERRRVMAWMCLYISLFAALWLWGALHRGRHLLPMLPLVSLLVAASMAAAWKHRGRVMRIGLMVLGGAVLCFHLAVAILHGAQFFPVTFGQQEEGEFLREKLWYHRDVEWMNENLGSGDRILHVTRLLNYYLDVDYYFASFWFQGHLDWTRIDSGVQLDSRLREMGVTHLFIDNHMFPIHESNAGSAAAPILKALGELVDLGAVVVYRDRRTAALSRTLGLGEIEVEPVIYDIQRKSGS